MASADGTSSASTLTSVADVLVAMSGGVDSTVAALVLQREGYDIAGVTMKLIGRDVLEDEEGSKCCSLDDVLDAKSACRKLGVEHFTFNFKSDFKHDVVDRFCSSYLSGQTPNPCIDCNRYLKFSGLQRRRRELGAKYVATGHYARRRFDDETGRWQLLRAADKAKDQSYVLYHLTQDDLKHMLFPLGELEKSQVRELAREAGFDNAEKSESQDICFVPDGDYASFISRYTGSKAGTLLDEPGQIVDKDGNVLGTHNGLARYTIGQRKGIGVASPEPLYVWDKDIENNLLVVAPRSGLFVSEATLEDVNVISEEAGNAIHSADFKTGYRQQLTPGTIELAGDGTARIEFAEPVVRPAPGQSVVAYEGDIVLGGGTVS